MSGAYVQASPIARGVVAGIDSRYVFALSTDWYCLPATSGSVVLISSSLDLETITGSGAYIILQFTQS